MTRPQDVFGAAPKSVLNKPFMHVQDQKPSGTDGGSSVVGDNQRDLNIVLTNEIEGAFLSDNKVILPPGEYWVEGSSTIFQTKDSVLHISDGINKILTGLCLFSASSSVHDSFESSVSGRVLLSEITTLSAITEVSNAVSTFGLGSGASFSTNNVFTDLRIWKLDSQIRTPVANNGGVYPVPASTYVTGNMFGLDYAKTGDHTIQVQPGVCFDALNSTLLTGALQTVTIPSAINTIYNLFLCNDGLVRTDTDVDGVNLSGTYQIRWIGFVRTTSTGTIVGFVMNKTFVSFGKVSENIIAGVATSFASIDHSNIIPVARIEAIMYGINDATSGMIYASDDGINVSFSVGVCDAGATDIIQGAWGTGTNGNNGFITLFGDREFKSSTGNLNLACQAVKLMR